MESDQWGDYQTMFSRALNRLVKIRRHSFGGSVEGVPYTHAELLALPYSSKKHILALHAKRLCELILDTEEVADDSPDLAPARRPPKNTWAPTRRGRIKVGTPRRPHR